MAARREDFTVSGAAVWPLLAALAAGADGPARDELEHAVGLPGDRARAGAADVVRDHTQPFPALAAAIAALGPSTLILDGEVVVFDAQLTSRFEWLRQRGPVAVSTPPIYMVFDLLRRGPHGKPRGTASRAGRTGMPSPDSVREIITKTARSDSS